MTYRLFLSVPLLPAQIVTLTAFSQNFPKQNLRWTKPQNLHITVLFLGEVKKEKIADLTSSLKRLSAIEPFKLNFQRFCLAPPYRPPRMIWAEFEKSLAFDRLCQKAYLFSCDFCSVRPPQREIPHVTLARFKDKLKSFDFPLNPPCLEALLVKQVCLMSSLLTPRGPIYNQLEKFNLHG